MAADGGWAVWVAVPAAEAGEVAVADSEDLEAARPAAAAPGADGEINWM